MKSDLYAKYTIYIVDDNPAVRDAIRFLVKQVGLTPKIFSSAQEFLDYFTIEMRGCLVLDIRMPGMSGLDLQEQLILLGAHIPIIIITGHGDVPITVRAMKSGAFEFLQKPFNDQVMLDTIQAALSQYDAIWEEDDKRNDASKSLKVLTKREREVLELLKNGKSNKLIARELSLSVRTIEGYRANITDKLGAKSLGVLIDMVIKSE
jgi:FixJ family two-component response regulator|tara:strand:+ start:4775 stop:5392 length:618 start_codon:yes stop_codon:yes gene_type:complete